ncbi:MAG: hypothetical protein EPO00_05600 [Chloroflexota bacterium]|nr:MAG: hypothetical protein EPO00_05600 [Chloroflexota bacterium]
MQPPYPISPRLSAQAARRRPRPSAVHALAVIGLTACLVAGCSTVQGTPGPTSTQSLSPVPSLAEPTAELTPVPTEPGATAAPTMPGQTDTDWGRIWDGLPTGFPTYPGAHPTETGAGPASATLDAGAAEPGAVMNFYQTALQGAGWIIVGASGPREDGSLELSGVDIHPACQVRVTVMPLGSSTIVSILYGAGCPFTG